MPTEPRPAPLELLGLRHQYGAVGVLDGVDLVTRPGELVAVLGASGCGKTTLLRAVAGLLQPTGGTIRIGGQTVSADGVEQIPVQHRGVGLVFQDYALFPHMSVAQNLAFGLAKQPAAAVRQRVQALLGLTGLDHLADRAPAALSGGQQQRVALARALAPRPHLLLLDEPFSNLDAQRREDLGDRTRAALAAEGASALLVTHDCADALRLGDRVAVLLPGAQGAQLAQCAAPETVYRQPDSVGVALATGPAWFIDAQAQGTVATSALGPLALAQAAQGPVTVMVRPEQAQFAPQPAGPHSLEGVAFVGQGFRLRVRTPAGLHTIRQAQRPNLGQGLLRFSEGLHHWPGPWSGRETA